MINNQRNEMNLKYSALILVCAFSLSSYCPLVSVSKANVIDQSDILTRKIRATTIKGQVFDRVLADLTSDYNIPIGIELGDYALGSRREIHLDLPEMSLKEFLDALFAKDSQHTWKLEHGVIHVWPLVGRDSFLATLLDTKISHFSITGGASKCQIYNDIMSLPEIRSRLIVAGVEPMIFLNSGTMQKIRKDIWFDETTLTLRELLDRIVQKTEGKRWVLYRWGKDNEFITLNS